MKAFYKRLSQISPLTWLLIISFFLRLFRLGQPPAYVFDEVYHVPTLRAYSQNLKDAYDPFAKSPEPNTAYDWLHPPLAKLIQAGSVKLVGDHSFAWRLPSAVFGTLSLFALYQLALILFKNQKLALLSAVLFSLDGLQLTMSRITMNDIFVTTFILFSLNFFFQFLKARSKIQTKKTLLFTGLFTGLALATKHSAILLYPVFFIFLLFKFKKFKPKQLFLIFTSLVLLPFSLYLLSYTQFFLQGHTLEQFRALHQQIYWYQTRLTATHPYQSSAWQWPLLFRPVWLYVDYQPNTIANIYNLGNPAIFWGGLLAAIYLLSQLNLKSLKAQLNQLYLLASYFLLFFPFVFSPRIMFLHHYLPALPFLCLILARVIYQNKSLTKKYLLLTALTFLFFYPLNTGLPIPKNLLKFFFWFPTWK